MKTSLPFLVAILGVSHAFTSSNPSQSVRNVELNAIHEEDTIRRSFVTGAIAVGASTLFTGPAFADVSDGNVLPQGAAQFSRVVKMKNDLKVRRGTVD